MNRITSTLYEPDQSPDAAMDAGRMVLLLIKTYAYLTGQALDYHLEPKDGEMIITARNGTYLDLDMIPHCDYELITPGPFTQADNLIDDHFSVVLAMQCRLPVELHRILSLARSSDLFEVEEFLVDFVVKNSVKLSNYSCHPCGIIYTTTLPLEQSDQMTLGAFTANLIRFNSDILSARLARFEPILQIAQQNKNLWTSDEKIKLVAEQFQEIIKYIADVDHINIALYSSLCYIAGDLSPICRAIRSREQREIDEDAVAVER